MILQTPLVTPGTTVDDPLVSASAAPPSVTVEPPPATVTVVTEPDGAVPDGVGPDDAVPGGAGPSVVGPAGGEPSVAGPVVGSVPAAERAPGDTGSDGSSSRGDPAAWWGYTGSDLVLLVLAVLAAGLALVGLRERVRVPGPSLLGVDPRERPFPAPARTLILAPGTESPPYLFERAAEKRFELRVDVLVLPVLARPTGRRAAWVECHDATDTWLWHESWLRSGMTPPTAVEADGLLIAGERDDAAPAGRLLTVPAQATVGVIPVAEGLILSRPAAGTSGELFQRWVRRVGIWRAEVRARPAAGVLLLHGVTSFPLALGLPVVAVLASAPPEVAAATLGPLAVGFLGATLRWAALDDLDRSTSLRFPAGRGALLLLTAPLHAATVWLATVRGLLSARPPQLFEARVIDEAAV